MSPTPVQVGLLNANRSELGQDYQIRAQLVNKVVFQRQSTVYLPNVNMPLELGERHAGGGKIATFPIVFTNDSKYVLELGLLAWTPFRALIPFLSCNTCILRSKNLYKS